MVKVCYVSAFYDIGRDNWQYFSRSTEQYIKAFRHYINMFSNNKDKDFEMILFLDKRHIDKVVLNPDTRIKIIGIDEDFMNTLHIWKTLPREREIISSEYYKQLIPNKLCFPEHLIPEYTLINHSKIDFINYAINNLTDAEYLVWSDFGYFDNKEHLIPTKFLDVDKFDKEKITYTLINPLDEMDKDPIYTLKIANEKIGGFFFFGNREKMKHYQALYHEILNDYQNKLGICDDDQALVLSCYYKKPELFSMVCLNGWHKAFFHFQKNN